jgi:hypothetical protein
MTLSNIHGYLAAFLALIYIILDSDPDDPI